MKNLNSIYQAIIPFVFIGISATAWAGGTELFPGDFDPVTPGTNVASVYLFQRDLSGYYVEGKPILGGGKIHGHAEVLGLTHYGKTGEFTSMVSVLLPYISAHRTEGIFPPGFGEKFSGIADPRLIYTIWPMNTPERTIAFSGTLFIPTGDYQETQVINAGDNRWKTTLQLGWVEQLAPNLKLDIVPEMTIYGKNHQYTGLPMTQANAYALTTFLRWRVLPVLETQIGYQANVGGEQTIFGQAQDNETRNQRVFLGLTTGLAKNLIVGLRYSQDTAVNYELKSTSDLVLRMHYAF